MLKLKGTSIGIGPLAVATGRHDKHNQFLWSGMTVKYHSSFKYNKVRF